MTKNTLFEKELGRKLKKIYKLLETSTFHNLKLEDDPINWAAFYGHEVAIKLLITLYPKLMHTPNKFGMTPIHMAAAKGHFEAQRIYASVSHTADGRKPKILLM